MSAHKDRLDEDKGLKSSSVSVGNPDKPPRKGPLSFLSGAITSGLLGWLSLGLSQRVVAYFVQHPPVYKSAIAQSIASGLKTLVIGMCFLATFTFIFIGLGLFLVFVRSLFGGEDQENA